MEKSLNWKKRHPSSGSTTVDQAVEDRDNRKTNRRKAPTMVRVAVRFAKHCVWALLICALTSRYTLVLWRAL